MILATENRQWNVVDDATLWRLPLYINREVFVIDLPYRNDLDATKTRIANSIATQVVLDPVLYFTEEAWAYEKAGDTDSYLDSLTLAGLYASAKGDLSYASSMAMLRGSARSRIKKDYDGAIRDLTLGIATSGKIAKPDRIDMDSRGTAYYARGAAHYLRGDSKEPRVNKRSKSTIIDSGGLRSSICRENVIVLN